LRTASTSGQVGSLLESHSFYNIDVDSIFLSKRANTHLILVGTLLAFLRDRVPTERWVSKILANIINGVGSPQELVIVSTTRVPSFGDDFQNPVNGYRSLGVLSPFRVEKSVPLTTSIQLDQELLAVNGNNPSTQGYLQTWYPCGVNAETHFIIVFTDLSIPSPNLSRHGSPFQNIRSTSIPRSHPGLRHSSVAPSPIGVLTSLHGLGDASFDTSRTGSPMIGTAINRQLSDSPSAHHSTPFSQDNAGIYLVPGTSVETVCRSHGITDAASQAAQYRPAEKTFLGKELNHQCMLEVLVKLGLQERYGTIFMPSRSVTYVGGLQLAAVEVIMAYGWSVDSYKHKTVWFGWAVEVSSRQWVKPIPSMYLCVVLCHLLISNLSVISNLRDGASALSVLAGNKIYMGSGGSVGLGLLPRQRLHKSRRTTGTKVQAKTH
jgi:hypothetical protein